MANEVRNKDLFAGDLFLTEIEKAKLLLKTLDELEQGFKDVAKAQKQIVNKEDNATIQSVQKTKKAIKELNEVEKAALTVQKQKKALGVQLRAANSKQNQQNQELKVQIQQQNKATKQLTLENKKIVGSYSALSAKLNRLRKEYKDVAVAEGETSSKAKQLRLEVKKLDSQLKKVDKTVGQSQRNVGNYGGAFSKLGGALKSGLGFLGITAGIAGITRVLSGSIKIAKEFEQGNANLASVLGVTASEIGALTDDAKRLGAATSFSATQVSSLQTEFAKLGFNEQEILNATEATLDLAAATGADLGEAAAVAGATLGGFGLDASETGRVADVMAKSFSTSALDLEKFKEAMKGAAPAAKAVGVDVEQTTALLGTLANAGISGSKAGNNLKTSFINLNAAGLTLEEGLEKVANSEDKLGTAAKLVGKNAAASFLVLADGVDVTKELEKGLNNAGGAAKKMADEQLNTLEGKTKILNSAWEGLVLSLLSGDGAFSSISKGLVEMATNLLGVLTPAEELESTWYAQRDAVDDLESGLSPLLDRYDDLKGKTELTKDEQVELDEIILKVAEDVPTAITAFDEYGKALDISTSAARTFIEQQKRMLALDNAEAITEQEELIIDLANSLKILNKEYLVQDKRLKKVRINQKSGVRTLVDATDAEIKSFQVIGEKIRLEILDREAKIQKLKGEKTAAEKAAEAEEALNASLGKNVTTLNSLNAELSELKKLRGDIDVTDKQSLKNNKELIKAKQKEIDLIEGKIAKDKKDKKEGKSNQDDELKRYNDFLTEKEKLENEYNDKQLTDKENELNSVEDKYFKLIEEAKEYGEDTSVLEDARLAEIEAINSKYRKKAAKTQEDADKKSDNERQKLADKEKKDREEQQKELREAIKRSIDAIAGFVDEGFTKQIQGIDKELDKTGDNIENLTEKANQGQLAAADSLAFEQKQEAELERDREETRKKQERTKAFFAVLDSFNANDGNVGKTISDIAVLKALASGFTAFDGVDDTGSRGNLDSKGGKAWILHPNEQVYSKKDREDLGFRSREEVKDIVKMYDNGTLSELMAHDISNDFISPTSFKLNGLGNNADVVNKLNQLNQSIKGIDIPEGMINIDEVRGLINLVSRKGNKKTTERSKLH
tara:strand:+ start:11131 stop:14517 length:3387 start_codon:yes stop_codon:yes gene_type:complete